MGVAAGVEEDRSRGLGRGWAEGGHGHSQAG